MHIIGVLSVKNESDFIERSIRFNAKNIDEFYIADDNSSDETREVLQSLILEGIKINLFSVASKKWSIEQNQSAIGELMLKTAYSRGFDYAFLLDADELILSSREHMESELKKISVSNLGLIPWKTFVPISRDCERHDYQLASTFRSLTKEPRQYWKSVISHAIAKDVQIQPGNHSVTRNNEDLPSTHLNMSLGHFPVRSADQFMAKIMIGYYKRTMKESLYQNEGYHQLLFFEEIKHKKFKLSFEDLQSMALRYTDASDDVVISAVPDSDLNADIPLKFPVVRAGFTGRLNGFIDELSQHYIKTREGASSNASTIRAIAAPAKFAKCHFKGVSFLVSTFGKGDAIADVLLEGQTWEPRVSEYIYRSVNGETGVYFIDVGANIGYTSCIARISGAQRVFSFECASNSFEKLKETIAINSFENIQTINTGLSDISAELDFQNVSGNAGASYIEDTHIGWTASEVHYAGKVVVRSFDSLKIDYSNARKIILKLDVEGHEYQALCGMPVLLSDQRLSTIIIEFNPETSFVQNLIATTSLLCEAGYNDIELIFKATSDGWSGDEASSNIQFEKITPKVIEQLLACGLIFELGFNRSH